MDTHNQLCQDCLKLEKKWITCDPFFHLATTLMGRNVTDTFLLANYRKVINYSTSTEDQDGPKIGIKQFSGMLAYQLIELAKKLTGGPLRFLPKEVEVEVPLVVDSKSDLSSPTFPETVSSEVKLVIWSLSDANGKNHDLVKYEITKDPSGRQRTKM
jgi:hypothetical protein